mmetsp:Transcript_96107/g.214037  ORF Transcript_96107/g.214037 Transcript_96107/m.214037 type:complete len:278 (-) Transcript_96107:608-1441(-)
MQCLHLALDIQLLTDGELHALIVIHEALEVEHVLVKGVLCLLLTPFLLSPLSLLRLLIVDVALVVAPGLCAVRRPGPQAEPTELMAATTVLGADHVVAALILLYSLVTLRALFRVSLNPTDVFGLRAIFDDPLVHPLAACRAVRFLPASPTPNPGTVTAYFARIHALVVASKRAARRIGAPLHKRIFVDVSPEEPLLVLRQPGLVAEASQKTARHDLSALVLRASNLGRSLALVYLAVQVAPPTLGTEAVAACEGQQTLFRVEADGALPTGEERRRG